jgi:hypothetical protein
MGRTTPTYRDRLRATRDEWADFERALRRRDRDAYEALWEHAHGYADAGGFQNPAEPMTAVLLSMLLAQERERRELAARLDALETHLNDVESTDE